MERRFKALTVVAWSALCLAAGLAGGTAVGFKLAGNFFDDLARPLMTSAGAQALSVVSFLDRKEEAKARWLLESEIDHAIQILQDERVRGDAISADLYQRLVRYRKEHPNERRLPDLPAASK